MIGPALKTLKTYFTAVGAALPQVLGLKHGQLNIKQASVTEDEAYLPTSLWWTRRTVGWKSEIVGPSGCIAATGPG
jgi:hypothetical protein